MSVATDIPRDELHAILKASPDIFRRIEQVEQQRTEIRARQSLGAFCQYMMPGFIMGPPQVALIEAVEEIERGENKRLMVFMPPRNGKSLIISQLAPCWLLGRHPGMQITQSGYGDSITMEQSRKARDFFASEELHRLFPHVRHRPGREAQRAIIIERQAAHEWGTTKGGRYYAASARSGLTGRGADIAIIDDPVKDRENADSITYRENTWRWYTSTLYTRLEPDAAIILVMTRWHEDDLAGRLLYEMSQGTGDKWRVVSMPAIYDEGTEGERALWPERWPLERLKKIRTAIQPREWNALYQQRPSSEGGSVFRRDWWTPDRRFDVHDSARAISCVSRAISLDTASKEGFENDYTAAAVGELSPDYRMALVHVERHKMEFPELLEWTIGICNEWNRDSKLEAILIEDAASGTALIQTLVAQAPKWIAQIVVPVQPKKSKVLRWREATTWCYNGRILLPIPCDAVPWLHPFETELFAVPSSKYDDQADTFAQLVWYWEHLFADGLGVDRQLVRH